MAIDAVALTSRAAEILTDEEFDFWSPEFHERSVSEAVCVISLISKSNMKTDCVFMTFMAEAGAQQTLEIADDQRFKGVESNGSGRSIRKYDRTKLDNLIPCWAEKTDDWKGYVEFWTDGGCDDGGFMLYPPPPAGHEIKVRLEQDPADLTVDDLGCEYESPILDYMLWRAFEREGSENVNKWQGYRQSFFDHMQMYKAVDQERVLREAGCYDTLCDKKEQMA